MDGDLVSVVISKGSPPSTLVARGPFAEGRQLLSINVASDSDGANITVTAQRQDANGDGFLDGDGLVNVGQINAVGVALGTITIGGDLGAIDAGGMKKIAALSLGRFGGVVIGSSATLAVPIAETRHDPERTARERFTRRPRSR